MEHAVLVLLLLHQEGEQVKVHVELLIDFIQVHVLPLHEQVQLLLCQHHLHQVGLDAARIGEEIDVLVLRGGVADEAEVELAHAGVVVVELRDDDLVYILEVDAGGEALLGAQEDSVAAVFQLLPQGAPSGKAGALPGDGEQGALRQVFPEGLCVGFQYHLVAHADGDDLIRPLRCHLHCRHDLYGGVSGVFLYGVRSRANPQEQDNLLDQAHHGVLPGIAGGSEIIFPHLVELVDGLSVYCLFFRRELEQHLVNPFDVLAGYLLKSPCDDGLAQEAVQYLRIVDVLGALLHAEDSDLFRQVGGGEQGVAFLVGRDGLAVKGIYILIRLIINIAVLVLAMAVDVAVPGDHVDGVVVEQLQLRGELRDVVPGAGARGEQLHPAAAEAGEYRLAPGAVGVGDFVTLVQNQLDVPSDALQIIA